MRSARFEEWTIRLGHFTLQPFTEFIEENAASVGMARASDVMRLKSAREGTAAKPWLSIPTWSIGTRLSTMTTAVVFAKEEEEWVVPGHCMQVETVGS